jgi:hypothetical protein
VKFQVVLALYDHALVYRVCTVPFRGEQHNKEKKKEEKKNKEKTQKKSPT